MVYSTMVKISRISAREFSSFKSVDLDLNDGLTAITGPNGSGKTSLARAVDLVRRALRAQATHSWNELTLLLAVRGVSEPTSGALLCMWSLAAPTWPC